MRGQLSPEHANLGSKSHTEIENVIAFLRRNVKIIMDEHRAMCRDQNPECTCCIHVELLRALFESGSFERRKLLRSFSTRDRDCVGTRFTLNRLLRSNLFTVHVGKSGYGILRDEWNIECTVREELVNARHEACRFLVDFLTARPEIAGDAHGEVLPRGGYNTLFRGIPVEGTEVLDAPMVLKKKSWVRIALNPDSRMQQYAWSNWCGGRDEASLETCFHGSTIECLGNQLRHGLEPGAWKDGGRIQHPGKELVYFCRFHHAATMIGYADAIRDIKSGLLFSVAWEVSADKQYAVNPHRARQCMYPRAAFLEKALWLRVLSCNTTVIQKEDVKTIRPGFVPCLEHNVK